MQFTLYTSDYTGNVANCLYPHAVVVSDKESFKQAIQKDHVCAKYRNNYRSTKNFIKADCLPMDCDNDHSDSPEDWKTPSDIKAAFPNVSFAVSYSRNHMKQKGNKSPRPRFHVIFSIDETTDVAEYFKLKKNALKAFPYFDSNAKDSARFLFATQNAEVEIIEGTSSLTEFLDDLEAIPEGKRNSTLSRFAGKVIKRYGDTPEAYNLFMAEAEKCTVPLSDQELDAIWNSARSFGRKIEKQEGYIPPERYNSKAFLKPGDFSDVGQAEVLAREYKSVLRYSPSTDYIVYNGSFWEESKPKAQAVAQDLTTRQLEEAKKEMKKAMTEMFENGAADLMASVGTKKAKEAFNEEQDHSYDKYESAVAYRSYAVQRRDSKYITSALKEARPMLEIDQKELDADEFLLNTPSATYDLRKGEGFMMVHNPNHLITKTTAVDPGNEGSEEWEAALNTFFCGDEELTQYVQKIVGLSAIGKVYVEALIIAYGDGRNGKSTFWNVVSKVLGSYSGNISADVLTVGCRRNVKPELAEAKGKRLLIAAELEEGMRLSTSNVKQLCSTDDIYAEKKYKDPFSYVPSHTLVLYTNHLPKVGAIDEGTWRRLIVIPFEAKIEGKSDVKNYADFLFEKAGSAVLSWVIKGAKKVIEDNFKIEPPQKVKDAIQEYKENNDWLGHFLIECCELDETFREKSGDLYDEYRAFCFRTGEFVRGTTDFYTALDLAGFERRKGNNGVLVKGLRLKSEFLQ